MGNQLAGASNTVIRDRIASPRALLRGSQRGASKIFDQNRQTSWVPKRSLRAYGKQWSLHMYAKGKHTFFKRFLPTSKCFVILYSSAMLTHSICQHCHLKLWDVIVYNLYPGGSGFGSLQRKMQSFIPVVPF